MVLSLLEFYVNFINWQYFLRHGKDFEPTPIDLVKRQREKGERLR